MSKKLVSDELTLASRVPMRRRKAQNWPDEYPIPGMPKS